MSLLQLPHTISNLNRLRHIALTMARHGFSAAVNRLRLAEYLPGLSVAAIPARFGGGKEERRRLSAPERMTLVLEELGATFIKFGQLLATRPDLIPKEYVHAFRRLQDQVEPLPGTEMAKVVVDRLGKPVRELFAVFEPEAIASGSIGQVHFATLHDGTPVVVKIKRPGTDRRVREDLDLLKALAALVEKHLPETRVFRPVMLVDEFARAMERELDFVCEASHTQSFAKEFADNTEVLIPNVFWDFTSHDTLVLERIEGVKLSDPALLEAGGVSAPRVADALADCFMRQYFLKGLFHSDPHPGNLFARADGTIALIDFGQIGHISDELRQQLVLSVIALANGDTDFIVDLYAEIGVFSDQTDLREFKTEFRFLINRYYGIPIDRMDIGEAFQETVNLARIHGIVLPRDFVLLGKSFVTIIGVIRQLDPDFRFDKAVRPFLREIFKSQLHPGGMLRRVGFYAYRLFSLVRRAPEDARDLIEKLRAGKIRIIFHHEGINDLSDNVERASNRVTVGMIVAAATVGSAIVLAADPKTMGTFPLPYLGEAPISILLSGIGFTGALVLGFWLVWRVLRSGRF